MPYKDLDEKRRHDREYRARQRLAKQNQLIKDFGITGEENFI